MKIRFVVMAMCLLFAFSACGSSPSSSGGSSRADKNKPAWVDSVESVYNRAQYVAAVGYGADRTMAEKNALANLTSIFGQSIFADRTVVDRYAEATQNGVTTSWGRNLTSENTINLKTSLDSLVGAEIREVWVDSRNTHYAAAVMEKSKTARVYNEMIQANMDMVNNLITMTPAEKNSLEGYSRYQFAAVVTDVSISYANVLQVLEAPLPAGFTKTNNYRLEAQQITKTIPIGITVKNDKAGRIQGAFAKVLSGMGFLSGGNNSRYVLDVNVVVGEAFFPPDPKREIQLKHARIELDANLTDTSQKTVLIPFNYADRDAKASYSEAENGAYMLAEKKINGEYAKLLNEYLSRSLPKR